MNNYLEHHGIKGQRWGIRRYQNPDGSLTAEGIVRYGYKNAKKSKNANLDKFGRDREHNVLYIGGYSGSGKSTVASSLYKKGDTIIRLDGYSEPGIIAEKIQSKKFNEFLDREVPKWREMRNSTDKSEIKRFSKDYFKVVDNFADAIEKYSKEEFNRGHKVYVEGIQIVDNWLRSSDSYYKGKPIMLLSTSKISSVLRAAERDDRKILKNAKEIVDTYKRMDARMTELSNTVGAKKNKDMIPDLYK